MIDTKLGIEFMTPMRWMHDMIWELKWVPTKHIYVLPWHCSVHIYVYKYFYSVATLEVKRIQTFDCRITYLSRDMRWEKNQRGKD